MNRIRLCELEAYFLTVFFFFKIMTLSVAFLKPSNSEAKKCFFTIAVKVLRYFHYTEALVSDSDEVSVFETAKQM